MNNMNHVFITGCVTRDPENKATAAGSHVLQFGLAVNEMRHNQQTNNWEEYTNYFNCVMFGKRAESLSRFLRKGMRVTVYGKLRYTSWEKDGQRRSKVDIIAADVELPPKPRTVEQVSGYTVDTLEDPNTWSQPVDSYDDIPF